MLLAALLLLAAACAPDEPEAEVGDADQEDTLTEGDPDEVTEPAAGPLTVYSGRSEELVGPIIEQFTDQTGIEVEVRYGDTAEMAATILEEGQNSPADLFFGQDAGALGALHLEDRAVELPQDILDRVDARFRSPASTWVGTSGRARVIAYNTDSIDEDELPASILDVTDERWSGRVGWAPTNGSFQAHVTAMRVELGDDVVRDWLEGLIDNDAQAYENNTAIAEALGRGEVDIGLTNHYYLYRFLAEDPDFPVDNHYLRGGDIGALVNIAGVAVLDTADDPETAFEFVSFLLTDEAQEYFAEEVFEHPLVPGVAGDPRIPDIAEIDTPDIDLSDLEDLQGTLDLLRDVGAL